MRAILRFIVWFADSLPLYSRRDLARPWMQGQEFERKQLGITRGAHGLFVSVTHKQISPPAMAGAAEALVPHRSKQRTESSGNGDLFLT